METVRFFLFTLSLLIFMGSEELIGQELTPVFENITEGLPSTEVHDMFQDSIGYMWFATDRGICRYNGDEMKIIDTDKDINTNVFFKFFKETETKVWLVTSNLQMYWFDPHAQKYTFHALPHNGKLAEMVRKSRYITNVSDIKFGKDGMTLLFRQAPGFVQIRHNGACTWHHSLEEIPVNVDYCFNLDLVVKDSFSFTKINLANKTQKGNYLQIKSEKFLIDKNSPIVFSNNIGVAVEFKTKSTHYWSVANILFYEKDGVVSKLTLPSDILTIYKRDKQILIGTLDGAFVLNDQHEVVSTFLHGYSITKLFESNSGAMWFSTLQNGIFVSQDLHAKELSVPLKIKPTDLIRVDNGVALYDQIGNQLLFLDTKSQSFTKIKKTVVFSQIIRTDDKKIEPFMKSKTNFRFDIISNKKFQFYQDNEDSLNYHIYLKKIFKRQGNQFKFFCTFDRNQEANFAFQYNQEKLIIGTTSGLYILHTQTKKINRNPIQTSDGLNFISYAILGGKAYFLSNTGIHTYQNGRLETFRVYNQKELKNIHKQNESTAWIYSDSKVYSLKIVDNDLVIHHTPIYSTWNKEGAIQSLIAFDNDLWIATKKGLLVVNTELREHKLEKRPFIFKLDSITLNSQLQKNYSNLKILNEDELMIYFDIICLDHSISRTLEYSLNGTKWFTMNKNTLTLSNLRASNHILRIRRVDSPNEIIFSMPFSVNKPFYQKWWFIILELSVFLFIINFIIFKAVRLREKKRNEELEKLNLELKLLTSKMNPHFTFNTINSIQYYILKSDKKEAIQYLSDFALLIRKSLDFSMAERITVEEEIHFLSLYVKMENKRFDANFQLKCNLEPPESILTKKIPSMLIQPLVENIILHAGYEESEDKIIEINIRFEQGYFTIQIIDYGKGITAKNDLNKHKSYGIDILKSRVKIYNGVDYKDSDVRIDSTPKGTTVTLKLKEWKR